MALCLERKVGEKIMVGDEIVITVRAVIRGAVKLSIEAPRGMRVDREEVRRRIEEEERHA
jgi:carbon storage regulator